MTARAITGAPAGAPRGLARTTGVGGHAADAGQASLELLMMLPVLAAVALAVLALLAGHAAREGADQAAVAAAVAQLQGLDATAAARDASPGWSTSRVAVAAGRATVTIVPRLPRSVAGLIDARRTVVFDSAAQAGKP